MFLPPFIKCMVHATLFKVVSIHHLFKTSSCEVGFAIAILQVRKALGWHKEQRGYNRGERRVEGEVRGAMVHTCEGPHKPP